MYTKTFISMCLCGDTDIAAIDSFVAHWHTGGDPRPLHRALGMSLAEYSRWVEETLTLEEIVSTHAIRESGIPLSRHSSKASLPRPRKHHLHRELVPA